MKAPTLTNPANRILPARSARVKNVRRERADVYVGRPSVWGNPFRMAPDGSDREEVIGRYLQHLLINPWLIRRARNELVNKTLGCFCAPLPCHADILAMLTGWLDPTASGPVKITIQPFHSER